MDELICHFPDGLRSCSNRSDMLCLLIPAAAPQSWHVSRNKAQQCWEHVQQELQQELQLGLWHLLSNRFNGS